MDTDVECYSGSRYAEKPVAFLYEGNRYHVAAVFAERQLENGKCFFVRTEEDFLFQLFYDITRDQWEVSNLRSGEVKNDRENSRHIFDI